MDGPSSLQRLNVPPPSGVDAPKAPGTSIWELLTKILRSIAIGLILQKVFLYAGTYIKAPLQENFAKPESIKSSVLDSSRALDPSQVRDYSMIPRNIIPLWTAPARINIDLYISEKKNFERHGEMPLVKERDIQIGNWTDIRRVTKVLTFPNGIINNGSLYAHIETYWSPESGQSQIDPVTPKDFVLRSCHVLTRFLPRRQTSDAKNLLAGSSEGSKTAASNIQSKLTPYYHPNFTLSVVGDAGILPLDSLHSTVMPYVVLDPSNARDKSGLDGYYLPILYEDDFWLLPDHMHPINSSVTELPFHFEINHVSLMRMQIFKSLDQAVKQQTESLGSSGGEAEEMKRIILETNIWLLGLTIGVSCLHSIFELLAFKNDISHFRSRKDNTGVSIRTILMNVFMQAIILLYLLDNQQNASYVILFGQGIGIAVELWKITRAVNFQVRPVSSIVPFRLHFEDKHALNESEKKTKEYDAYATTHLLYASVPLLILYAIYSVIYNDHKGWWSFLITTLVGFVYLYGFLTMIPSLYINYKLKSVAHMSRRTLIYKFLNTIVDDGFAFIIRQPLLSRLAAFRDDLVFIIFIYQMFIYQVDKTRMNEFGQGSKELAAGIKQQQ